MQLTIHHFDLKLRHRFAISRGGVSVQPTLIVELEDQGFHGYGEATSNDYYGVTIDNMTAVLEAARESIESSTIDDPAAFWEAMRPQLAHSPFAQCALDQAAHDLWGKRLGKPVWQLWGLKLEGLPRSNYTIGIDEIDVMVAKLKEFPDWPIYKIKLGTKRDLEIVRELRRHTGAVFRVDANCAWTAEETIVNSHELKALNVEFIEQPLPAEKIDDMPVVLAESALPLVADENCQIEQDVRRCEGRFHGVNIKLVKCGGLTPARRMIDDAKSRGLRTMVGCMTESSVGISAIAQLLPLLDYVDMDGAALLDYDIARGAAVERGVCRYPDENGCGVELGLSSANHSHFE